MLNSTYLSITVNLYVASTEPFIAANLQAKL